MKKHMEKETQAQLKERLKLLLDTQALRRGEFILSSGKKSGYYLDGRVITLTPEGAYLVARLLLIKAKAESIDAIGGPTLGADPIVGAVAALSHPEGVPLRAFIVRKAAKEHGMQRQIEGPDLSGARNVLLVDDVATTGKALIEAKAALDQAGIAVSRAMVIVDRNEGAKENLARVGLALESIFTIRDFGL
ncbi:MAG: orotate phosphoribosyltransferase [Candidatus Omnitrophica bacterium]|nr:orotate phosphoribosyltransferase [Candidatus Omnitrophota bacterium]